jgi:hypothetical protein
LSSLAIITTGRLIELEQTCSLRQALAAMHVQRVVRGYLHRRQRNLRLEANALSRRVAAPGVVDVTE